VAQPRFGPDESFPLTDERLVGAGPGLSLADFMLFVFARQHQRVRNPHPFFGTSFRALQSVLQNFFLCSRSSGVATQASTWLPSGLFAFGHTTTLL
jgi:hypothetical protein